MVTSSQFEADGVKYVGVRAVRSLMASSERLNKKGGATFINGGLIFKFIFGAPMGGPTFREKKFSLFFTD